MPTGTVKFYNDEKGYGFIGPDGGESDIFFHVTHVADDVDLDDLTDGRRVHFDQAMNERRGKPEARNVRVDNVTSDASGAALKSAAGA